MKSLSGSSLLFFLLPAFLLCCSDPENGKETPMEEDPGTSEESELDTLEEPKAFVLPTPTQIPTLLEQGAKSYHPELLLNVDSIPTSLKKKEKALRMGALLIDAVYSGLHDDPPRVKRFVRKVRKLGNDLYLSAAFERKRLERLLEVADRKDELADEMLSFYRDAHEKFRKEGKKKLGFHMIQGAFLEGLYLSVHLEEEIPRLSTSRIMEQQRRYLENIGELREILFHGQDGVSRAWKELRDAFQKGDEEPTLSREQVKRVRQRILFEEG